MTASALTTKLPDPPVLPSDGSLTFNERYYDGEHSDPYHIIPSGEHYLMLEKLRSTFPGNKFGTIAYKKFMYEAVREGFPSTHIRTNASWTSHVFHLYMGMKPVYLGHFGKLISDLLDYHRVNTQKIPDPNIINFGSYMMEMSPEGLERWNHDIYEVTPFSPFRDFSHLKTTLTTYCVWRNTIIDTTAEKLPLLSEDALEELSGRIQGTIPIKLPVDDESYDQETGWWIDPASSEIDPELSE